MTSVRCRERPLLADRRDSVGKPAYAVLMSATGHVSHSGYPRMSDTPFLTPHFWLLLVLYPGLAGAIYFHIRLRKHVAAGSIEADALKRFELGWVLAISIPSLALWLLAMSAPTPSLDPFTWGAPQKWIALGVAFVCWVLLLAWVWLRGGAALLSRYLSMAFPRWQSGLNPARIRIVAILLVAAGMCSVLLRIHASAPEV